MISKISFTMNGASPIEGSSSSKSVGRAMRPRPSATICCSPPERYPAFRPRRSRRRGKYSITRSMSRATPGSILARKGARAQVLHHGELRKEPPPLHHVSDAESPPRRPGRVHRSGGRANARDPVVTRPCSASRRFEIALSVVDLPGTVRAEDGDGRACGHLERNASKHLDHAVVGDLDSRRAEAGARVSLRGRRGLHLLAIGLGRLLDLRAHHRLIGRHPARDRRPLDLPSQVWKTCASMPPWFLAEKTSCGIMPLGAELREARVVELDHAVAVAHLLAVQRRAVRLDARCASLPRS